MEYPDNGLLISTKNDLLTSHEKKKKQAMKRHRGTYVKCKLLSKISPI